MKSIKVCFASLGLLLLVSKANAFFGAELNQQVPAGVNYKTLTSSGQIFTGGGVLYGSIASTGDGVSTWFQYYDTSVQNPNAASLTLLQSVSTWTVTPQELMTLSTNTVQGQMQVNFMPYGLTIQNGLYLYFPAGVNQSKVTTIYSK